MKQPSTDKPTTVADEHPAEENDCHSTPSTRPASCSQLAINLKSPQILTSRSRCPKDTYPTPAVITRNNFIFKSHSDWSFNIANG